MDIRGLDKAEVLAALYNRARVQGLGFLHSKPGDMTVEEARKIIEQSGRNLYFDYLHGRVMKIDVGGEFLDTVLYDRDNGQGAAEEAILELVTRPGRKK